GRQARTGRPGAAPPGGRALLLPAGVHGGAAGALDAPGGRLRPGRRAGDPLRRWPAGFGGAAQARHRPAPGRRRDRQLEPRPAAPQPPRALLQRLHRRVPAVRAGPGWGRGGAALRRGPAAVLSRRAPRQRAAALRPRPSTRLAPPVGSRVWEAPTTPPSW